MNFALNCRVCYSVDVIVNETPEITKICKQKRKYGKFKTGVGQGLLCVAVKFLKKGIKSADMRTWNVLAGLILRSEQLNSCVQEAFAK